MRWAYPVGILWHNSVELHRLTYDFYPPPARKATFGLQIHPGEVPAEYLKPHNLKPLGELLATFWLDKDIPRDQFLRLTKKSKVVVRRRIHSVVLADQHAISAQSVAKFVSKESERREKQFGLAALVILEAAKYDGIAGE